tara:strand:+ start:51 stop:275 length:225 start_codon:yes stop_codon:yes gene_type:complete
VLILYLAQLLPLVVVRAGVTMVLVHLEVLVAQEVERLVLTLAAVLALAQQVKVLLAVLQPPLERPEAVVAVGQA